MKRVTTLRHYDCLCFHVDDCFHVCKTIFIFAAGMTLSAAGLFAQTANDSCFAAIPIACGETLRGTTVGATADPVGFCGVPATAPGVFYSFTGTGQQVTVSLCSPNTDYDSKLSVFTGACDSLVCVDGSDDFCDFSAQVTFMSDSGKSYFFYVHGFQSDVGNFDISVTCGADTGTAVSCSAPALPVSDSLAPTTATIVMATGSSDVITDLNVSVTITHTYISDLTIELQSPAGTSVTLFIQNCGSLNDMDALFDDSAGTLVCPPFGSMRPAEALAAFIGESIDGTWTLSVTDNFSGDDGTLIEWCLIPTLGPPIVVPNDECADAIEIACGQTLFGSTVGADTDDDVAPPCGIVTVNSPGVWYKLTGDGSNVTVSTCNAASYDTKISVYTNGCGTLTCVAGNDDTPQCAALTSEVSFATTPGAEYLIMVHGFGGAVGDFALTISCAGAPSNDNCADAIPVFCNQIVSGSTVGTTADSTGTCGTTNTSPGVWYSFTGTGDFVTLSTCGTASYDTKLSVFTGTCGQLTCVGGNDDFTGCIGFTSRFGFLSEAGTEYLILVHGFLNATGTFDLSLTCTPITVANDFCTGAIDILCGESVSGSTAEATPDNQTTCVTSNTAAGVWYRFTGDGSVVTATTCNAATGYDTKISVYVGVCGSLVCVTGDDDDNSCAADPFFSTVSWGTAAGTDYFILVHGFGSDAGTFELSLTCAAPLPNDDCSGAVPVTLTNGVPITLTGNTVGATASPEETAILTAAAVWQAVTLTGTCNNLTLDYCGTALGVMDFFFIGYTDCPLTTFTAGTPDLTACFDGNGTTRFLNLPAGTYYLPVLADPAFVDPGDYTMNLLSADCPPPPANDNVCAAEQLTLGIPAPFTNLSATPQPGEVTPGAGTGNTLPESCDAEDGWCSSDTAVQNSVWYFFTAPASGHVLVSAESLDMQIAVYTAGSCSDFSSFTEVAANDDSSPECLFCPYLDLNCLIPGQRYYVQLDGFDGEAGSGTITATDGGPASIVTGYTVVNSVTDTDVVPLLDGDIINKRLLPGFNIRADICRPVGSVKFALNGSHFRTENVIPYALYGDHPAGNYFNWNPAPGDYQMVTSPFTAAGGGGAPAGLPDTINFKVVDEVCQILTIVINTDAFAEETSFELTDLTDNTILASAAAGSLVSSSTFRKSLCVSAAHCFEFRMFDAFGDGICCTFGNGSYAVTYGGTVVASGGAFSTEEITSFGNCNFDCAGVLGGTSVTDVNGTCCDAAELDCDGVCSGGNTSGLRITSFTLVDAGDDTDIALLQDGDTVDLSLFSPISVRANPCSATGSVRFLLNGTSVKVERVSPYVIAGDSPYGNYHPWNITPGVYTIEAIPYASSNGTGPAGISLTITITIVGSASKTGAAESSTLPTVEGDEPLVYAYPNPFKNYLTFEFSVPGDAHVWLELFSISGTKVATVFEGKVKGAVLNKKGFYPQQIADGLYIYRLKTSESVITGRVTLVR